MGGGEVTSKDIDDMVKEIEKKLQEYKDTHNGKDFMCDVSTKTIEDICQLLQCQPQDLIFILFQF